VFGAAILVFTLGSIFCGFSGSLAELVGARLLQGLGGAMMVPIGRLVLLRSVPKADLVTAMAYLTVPALIGPVVGPLLGGFITTYLHWRWIFWINVPIAVLGWPWSPASSPTCARSGPRRSTSRVSASAPSAWWA
jgi:MFS family permease